MLLAHQKGPGKLQDLESCVGSRQGQSEELEVRGLARLQKAPRVSPTDRFITRLYDFQA